MELFGTDVDPMPKRRPIPGRRMAIRSWRIPKVPRPSEWMPQNIVIPPGISATPGRFSFDARPWWIPVVDWAADQNRKVICAIAGSQGGKSTHIMGLTGWRAATLPAPVTWFRESGPKTTEAIRETLIPIYQASPNLRRILREDRDAVRKDGLRFESGGYLIADSIGGKSAAQGRSPALCCVDELDKCILLNPKLGDLMDRLLKRVLTWDVLGKLYAISTPSYDNKGIWAEWLVSQQWEWIVPCPNCGREAPLSFFGFLEDGSCPVDLTGIDATLLHGGVRWPRLADGEHPDPSRLLASKAAWYECPACGHRIDDANKQTEIHKGALQNRTPDVSGYKTAAHLPGLLFPEYSWSRLASEFLAARHSPSKMVVLRNEVLALPQTTRKEKPVTINSLDSLKIHYYRQGTAGPCEVQKIPKGVERIYFAADAQKVEFWGILEGVGYEGESWTLWAGRLDSKEQIRRVASAIWTREDEAMLGLSLGGIDTGDGNRTHELYQFIASLPRFMALKGRRATEKVLQFSNQDIRLPNGHVIESGIQLYNWQTTHFQDALQQQIDLGGGAGAGALHIPDDVPREWMDHIRSEHRVERLVDGRPQWIWEPVFASAPNHLRDAHCMAKVLAYHDGWGCKPRAPMLSETEREEYLKIISGQVGF